MNNNILNTGIQEFINKNINTDISSLLLKGINLEGVTDKDVVEQIEAKAKSKTKLPTWFKTAQIYYPNKLNIEQTSSEVTAQYKASLVDGKSMVDITGGFGIDAYFFAKQFDEVFHCEINSDLSKIATHNFQVLGAENITTITEDGISFLEKTNKTFDCIYVDPSRRNDVKNKVFLLQDCAPNMPLVLPLLFTKTSTVLVKTSPLLDISIGIEALKKVSEIHIVAVQNEVKELLWILKDTAIHTPKIKTINLTKSENERFDFQLSDESTSEAILSEPLKYLYEPNAAILKSGAFNSLPEKLQLKKLHKHTHLYTSEKLTDFPGRSFEIINILPYNKKVLKKEIPNSKANITTRNFPETVAQIRKKTKIADGGDIFLFFCTNLQNEKIVIQCKKIN
ncbi:class I SAM-dependent methyltransferase [Joostella sp. CR20]|uniref:class I SAM-dependent methyltransferase n=1 Tax=Joostella sp. CR20 TaxID=2804312 RepID=UPI00313EB683